MIDGVEKMESDSSQRHKKHWTHGKFPHGARKSFFSVRVVEQGCRISILGNIPSPEHHDLVDHALSSRLDMETTRQSFQLVQLCDKVYIVAVS